MAEKNGCRLDGFSKAITDEQKHKGSFVLLEMMKKVTGKEPVLYSNSIIGYW